MPVLAERPPSSFAGSITPTPRQTSINGAASRPRPLSMPMAPSPQQYMSPHAGGVGGDTRATAASANESAARADNGNVNSNGAGMSPGANRVQKPRNSNRVLGDYTLGKTIGAGSMGKVKLAYHNITGEKVRICTFYTSFEKT